jgi:hypothetical protein
MALVFGTTSATDCGQPRSGFSFAIAALPLESALMPLVRRLGVGPPEILTPMRHRWDRTGAER